MTIAMVTVRLTAVPAVLAGIILGGCATVDVDNVQRQRTAKETANRITEAYQRRGWLPQQ